MIQYTKREIEEYDQIRLFAEKILKRNVGQELVSTTVLETLNVLTENLLEKTKRSNCNCVNRREYEELEKEEQGLITLRKLMGWETW